MTAAVDTHRCAVRRAHCYQQHAALTGQLLPLVSVLERTGRGSPLPAARRGVSPPRSPRRGVEYTVLTQWQHDEPQGRGEEEDSEEPALEVRPLCPHLRATARPAPHRTAHPASVDGCLLSLRVLRVSIGAVCAVLGCPPSRSLRDGPCWWRRRTTLWALTRTHTTSSRWWAMDPLRWGSTAAPRSRGWT